LLPWLIAVLLVLSIGELYFLRFLVVYFDGSLRSIKKGDAMTWNSEKQD
jgi:hypothetical protein